MALVITAFSDPNKKRDYCGSKSIPHNDIIFRIDILTYFNLITM